VRLPSRGTFVAQQSVRKNAAAFQTRHATLGVSGLGFSFAGSSSYWAKLLQGMRETATGAQAQLMLLDHTTLTGWEKADGVLLCEWTAHQLIASLPDNLPRVSLMSSMPNMESVLADDYSGGCLATEHLLQLGHRRVAYLYKYGKASPQAVARQSGYCDAMRAAGIEPDANWMRQLARSSENDFGANVVATGREGMRLWIEENWRKLGCTALLAHNDEVAVGSCEALQEAGFDVPGEVSVVGFDNIEISEYCRPRLTTIEVPLARIANAATEILLRQINSDSATQSAQSRQQVLPVQLKVRESTAPPPRH